MKLWSNENNFGNCKHLMDRDHRRIQNQIKYIGEINRREIGLKNIEMWKIIKNGNKQEK